MIANNMYLLLFFAKKCFSFLLCFFARSDIFVIKHILFITILEGLFGKHPEMRIMNIMIKIF